MVGWGCCEVEGMSDTYPQVGRMEVQAQTSQLDNTVGPTNELPAEPLVWSVRFGEVERVTPWLSRCHCFYNFGVDFYYIGLTSRC